MVTELAEGRNCAGVRHNVQYWNQEFQRIHSPILRYGFSVISVAIALGGALASQHYQFRDVELPVFTVAIAFTTWYAGAGPSVLAVLLSIASFDYFFTLPLYSFAISAGGLPYYFIFVVWAVIVASFSAVRSRIEDNLRRSAMYLAEAQRLSHTGSFGWAPASGKIYWSAETYRIFGYAPTTEPRIQMVLDRTHPDDRMRLRQIIGGAVAERREFTAEHRLVMPDGAVKHVRAVAHALTGEDPESFVLVGAVMDITERHRAEEERERLSQLEAVLAYMNRVSMMGELAASLAHEIKQPIAAAAINAQACMTWLNRDAPDVAEASRAALATVAAVTRAGGIIDRVSSLFRRSTAKRELVDLNEIVGEICELLGDTANRKAVSIRTDLDPELPTTTADRIQLQQVLMNLMLNGIEAMQDKCGELTVASKRTEDGQLLISVSDTGIGLSIDEAERIFEAFFTTKPRGTGMGLSVSRRIIASHGGQLWASPNTGRGATFQFTLPVETTASLPEDT
jgi:PAS domain S-box-containing protein